MAEEQPQSIADRIASLKLNQVGVGRAPGSGVRPTSNGTSTGRPRPPPPPPPRPALPARPNSSNVPTLQDHAPVTNGGIGNQPERSQPDGIANGMDGISRPALPPRTSTTSSQSPALPARRPSESPALPQRRPSETPSNSSRRTSNLALNQKASNESISSVATARSDYSAVSNGTGRTSQSERRAVRAPIFDASSLPALPPKRTPEEKEADDRKYRPKSSRFNLPRMNSSPNVQQKQDGTTPPPPARPSVRLPPSLPSRTAPTGEETGVGSGRIEPLTRLRAQPPPPPSTKRSPLTMGLNPSSEMPPPLPGARPGSTSSVPSNGGPPTIPKSSRPDLAALQASKPRPNGGLAATAPSDPISQDSCLLCRDYSEPDNHAARFPRQSIPSQDVGWVAQQLTSPFPSHTDKARALFTWLHHNVEYDVVAFFNNNVKPSTPQSTLSTGLAVCEGYAGLFAAMAMKVGLEAYVISGHGKGYGHSKLQPGEPMPPYSAGHAWNVVRIDGGVWKLIDCCWGAGTVAGKGQPYTKRFATERFTQTNEDFGLDHFPGDSKQQFRADGSVVSWEDYMLGSKRGCSADFYSGFVAEEGLVAPSFQPTQNPLVLANIPGPTVRFSFQKCCPHWDPVRCGKGPYYLYLLHLGALDGQNTLEGLKKEYNPFSTNGDVWWVDIPKQDLGKPGQKVEIYAVNVFDGKSARGLTKESWSTRPWAGTFGGVCAWTIA